MQWAKQKSGFTIVELLIVVVVIAILAAITIVAYNGIQARTTVAAIQSDLRGSMNKIEAYKVLNNTYPDNTDSALTAVGLSISKGLYPTTGGNYLYCGSNGTPNYVIIVLGRDGKTYAAGSNRTFSEYTTYAVGDYTNVCPDVNSNSSARYGYTTSNGWRWVN